MPDVLCLGEMFIGFVVTEPGVALSEATAFTKAPGGAPANAVGTLTTTAREAVPALPTPEQVAQLIAQYQDGA